MIAAGKYFVATGGPADPVLTQAGGPAVNTIAADQNSRGHDGVTLYAIEAHGCHGCHFDTGSRCTISADRVCTRNQRKDDRAIIWVERKPTENHATVAADILRAQGEDVDEAACEELVTPAEDAEVRRIAEAACRAAAQEMEDYIRGDAARRREERPTDPRLITGTGSKANQCADKRDAFSIIFDDPAYASLGLVLTRAYTQAATGKGAERHGQGQPLERQPMQDLIRLHGVGFATGQASKKSQEALRLPRGRAVAELLGAINYLAGAIIAIEAGDTHHKD